MPLAYGIGGLINVPQGAVRGQGSPPASFKGQLGQMYFDVSVADPIMWVYNGTSWQEGGNALATTTEPGIVEIDTTVTGADTNDTVPTSLAVFNYGQTLALAGANPASEITAGIAEIATQVETDAGTDDTRIVTPLKLANFVSAGGFAGSFTDLTATGTVSFTGATGAYTITSATASSVGTTGAGIDLTLASASGRVVVNGEEAAADAVRVLSAAGGLDVDVALQMNLASSQNAVDAIRIVASAGGIDIDAVGAATEDINITNTGGSVVIVATENAADAIVLNASAGGIDITAAGAATEDIDITNTAGSIRLTSGEAVADSMVFASSGGIDADAVGQINLRSTQNAVDSIVIESTLGGIDILASGATAEDIDIINTGGSVNLESTEDAALAIYLHANGGTSETIRLRSDLGTGAASIDVLSDVGGITLTAGLATADAINLVTSAAGGGIDIDAGTAGIAVDTTGAFSIDGAAASNVTVTGAGIDLTLASSLGSVLVSSTEDAALAIMLHANGGTSETIRVRSDQGTGVDSLDLLSDVGGITLTAGLATADAINLVTSNAGGGIDVDAGTAGIAVDTTGAFSIDGAAASNVTTTGAGIDLTLSSSLGSVLVEATEDAALAIRLHANGGTSETIQIHSDLGTGVASIDVLSDVGGITLTSGLASADAINLVASAGGVDVDGALQVNIASSQNAVDAIRIVASAGGIDIDAVGAATEDINITNTGGSVVVVATEAIADAILLNASNAAGGIDLTTGGGSVDISSAGFATVVAATDTQASPSATATINANVGRATFTGFTTAAAGSQVFVITNSVVTTSSCVLVTVCTEGANDAQMTVTRVTRAAGSLSVTCQNLGSAAVNGNIAVNFWVLTA